MDAVRSAYAHAEQHVRYRRCSHRHRQALERPYARKYDDGLEGTYELASIQDWTDICCQFWWVCYFAYCLSMIGAKISVGLSLLRYTPIFQKSFRCITHIVIYTSVVMGMIYGLLAMFQCSPVDYFWTRALGAKGTCISMDIIIAFTYAMSAIFAVCDFSFALLPIFLIKGLNMSRNQKFALIPILSMACM
jgi:hypothetical protein